MSRLNWRTPSAPRAAGEANQKSAATAMVNPCDFFIRPLTTLAGREFNWNGIWLGGMRGPLGRCFTRLESLNMASGPYVTRGAGDDKRNLAFDSLESPKDDAKRWFARVIGLASLSWSFWD